MKFKNYRNESLLPNIFNEIESTLAAPTAKQITREYDQNGKNVAISIIVPSHAGNLSIKLPARFDRVEQIFKQ